MNKYLDKFIFIYTIMVTAHISVARMAVTGLSCGLPCQGTSRANSFEFLGTGCTALQLFIRPCRPALPLDVPL